ncbi:tyrosine-type recombinase/integrase [bacterium]|nr:tyrosine-type recombinase/integrase [bacterium]MBU1675363.1 tyrosine-type recombinase/integrase [bacterium]
MNVPEAVDQYLESLKGEGRSPHTIAAYRRDLAAFVAFVGKLDLNAVTPSLLQRFMASQGVQLRPCGTQRAKATINRYRVALKALFAFCEARWLVERNPTSILKCRRQRGLPPVVLDAEEIGRLVNSELTGPTGPRDHALVCFMLLTGCRLAETAALNVADIDLDGGVVVLRSPKGGDPDRVMLSPQLAKILEVYIGKNSRPNAPLFTASTRRLSIRQIQRIVTSRVHEANITKRITAHSLRHSFATRLYNQTGDIRLVQLALRHSHVTTTEVYTQVEAKRWREAISTIAKRSKCLICPTM